jgi:microcystin degradation protein MlrC
MRIGIIGLLHESNTFSSKKTQVGDFSEDTLVVGNDVIDHFVGVHHELGGFIEGLRQPEHSNIQTVGLFAARALPSGVITKACFETLVGQMFQAVENAGPLDGLLVAPHGATVSEEQSDADGYWLSCLRDIVGENVPIIGTLDPHANVSRAMIESCNALMAYRTNPHLDQQARGVEAAHLLVRTVAGEVRPSMAAVPLPLAISIDRQCTSESPLHQYCARLDLQRSHPKVLSNSLILGFPYADVRELGSATLVVTDDNLELAQRLAVESASDLWQNRLQLCCSAPTLDNAWPEIVASSDRICLLDMGDNVGGGSSADGTVLLQQFMRTQFQSALVCIYDPESVQTCSAGGVGSVVGLQIGGKTDTMHGGPVDAQGKVLSLHDGVFREPHPRHGGFTEFNQGLTAIVQLNQGPTVMLTSRRMVPFSLEQIRSCGLDPTDYKVLVAKGVNAPIAAYREVCPSMVRVDTPGSTSANLFRLKYQHRSFPCFPWEEQANWTPEQATVYRGRAMT